MAGDQSTDNDQGNSVNAIGSVAKGAYNDDGSVSTKFRPETPDNTADNSMGQVSGGIMEVVKRPHD